MNHNEATGMLCGAYGDAVIKAPCTVDIEDMSINPTMIEVNGLGGPDREWFEPDQDSQEAYGMAEEIELCWECKQYLIRPIVSDTDGTNLEPGYECPECGEI